MSTYKTPQNKKTLGLTNLKGVSVRNQETDNGYIVTFRAEAQNNGDRFYGSYTTSSSQAAKDANNLFRQIYGNARAAQKANRWNKI